MGDVWICAACGRPRVPVERDDVVVSRSAQASLERVATARSRYIVARLGLGAAIALDVLTTLLGGLAAAGGSMGIAVPLLVFSAFATLMAVLAFTVGRASQASANAAMREAIGSVAVDTMRARGPVSAAHFAESLGVPVDVAERALASLPARTDVRVDSYVDERATDGQVRYRIADASVPLDDAAIEREIADESADFDARLAASKQKKARP